MSDSVNPMELLKDEMDHDEIINRINAIHRLRVVAQLLTPDQIKTQLLTYLDQLIKKEDDEVLFALATELGQLSSMTIVQPTILVPILEQLCSVEETMVRNQAVQSLLSISQQLTDNEIQTVFMPMVMRLASTETSFTSRVSAVNLMCSIYTRSLSFKDNIRNKFNELCREETPIVKKAVAKKIGEFAKVLEKQHILNELIQQFKDLASDDQDSVRVCCLNSLNSIVKTLSKDLNKTHILPVLIQSTEDKSWKIRHALASNFPSLIDAFNKEITEMNLIGIFSQLLRDNENEVKLQTIKSLSQFVGNLQNDKIIALIPNLIQLMADNVAEVRQNVCDVLCVVFIKLGKDQQILKFNTLLVKLIEDDHPEVKIANLKAISKYIQVLGTDQLMGFIPALKNSANSPKWRVRLQTFITLLDISCSIKNLEVFIKQLEPMIINALKDKIYDIRYTMVLRIKDICQVYKTEWLEKSLLQKLVDILNSSNYILRISVAQSLESICGNVPNDYYFNKVNPILLKVGKDPISNVKIVFCKVAKKVLKTLQENQIQQIKQLLNELVSDQDRDVQYFAQEALP